LGADVFGVRVGQVVEDGESLRPGVASGGGVVGVAEPDQGLDLADAVAQGEVAAASQGSNPCEAATCSLVDPQPRLGGRRRPWWHAARWVAVGVKRRSS
jgi:hypothetical protein